MWRAEPPEVKELRKALTSLYGLPIGFMALNALEVDIPEPLMAVFLLVMVAVVLSHSHLGLNVLDVFRRRLTMRRLPCPPPRHAFHAKVTIGEGDRAAEDFGILQFSDGFVSFQGLRTEFSIPQDLLRETSDGREFVQVEDRRVKLRFHRWKARGTERVSTHPFDPAEKTRTERPLTILPTECTEGADPAHVRHLKRTFAFWFLYIAIAYAQHSYLGARNLKEAQTLLETTLALTLFASAIPPLIRIGRLFLAVRPPQANDLLAPLATPIPSETLDPAHVATRSSIR